MNHQTIAIAALDGRRFEHHAQKNIDVVNEYKCAYVNVALHYDSQDDNVSDLNNYPNNVVTTMSTK